MITGRQLRQTLFFFSGIAQMQTEGDKGKWLTQHSVTPRLQAVLMYFSQKKNKKKTSLKHITKLRALSTVKTAIKCEIKKGGKNLGSLSTKSRMSVACKQFLNSKTRFPKAPLSKNRTSHKSITCNFNAFFHLPSV